MNVKVIWMVSAGDSGIAFDNPDKIRDMVSRIISSRDGMLTDREMFNHVICRLTNIESPKVSIIPFTDSDGINGAVKIERFQII